MTNRKSTNGTWECSIDGKGHVATFTNLEDAKDWTVEYLDDLANDDDHLVWESYYEGTQWECVIRSADRKSSGASVLITNTTR